MANQSVKSEKTSQLVSRLRQVMAVKEITPRSWSLQATGSSDTVRNILRGGSESPRSDTLRRLAAAANIRVEFLIGTSDEMEDETREQPKFDAVEAGTINVIGYIGAGDQVFHFRIDDPRETVPAPPGIDRGIAAYVRGTSMVPAYRPGELVIAAAHDGKVSDLIGQDCFVQVLDGPLYLKRLKREIKDRFDLESYDDVPVISHQMVEWAAPVRWVRRK